VSHFNISEREGAITAWVIFVLFLTITPFYLRQAGVTKARQIIIATASFAVWVFAVTPNGGPFAFKHHDFYAALLLPLYTFIIPVIAPDPKVPVIARDPNRSPSVPGDANP
jgi:hypothetical protein